MMTENRDRTLIAVILIFFGLIFLGDTLGQYNFRIILFLRSCWPAVLIIFGFHILLKESSFWFMIPLIVSGLAVYLIYLLYNNEGIYFIPDFKIRIFNFRHLFNQQPNRIENFVSSLNLFK